MATKLGLPLGHEVESSVRVVERPRVFFGDFVSANDRFLLHARPMAKRRNQRQRRKSKPKARIRNHDSGLKPLHPGSPFSLLKRDMAEVRDGESVMHLFEYSVTWDTLPCPEIDRLPQSIQNQIGDLYEEARNGDTSKVLEPLKQLYCEHPEVPQLGNWLSVAHQRLDQEDERQAVLMELIERHPNYLFARLGMANLAIEGGNWEQVPDFLGEMLFLPALIRDRREFHISEVLSFSHTVGRYHWLNDDHKAAESHLKMMEDWEPSHPATQDLRRLLRGENRFLPKVLAGMNRLVKDAEDLEKRRQARKNSRNTRRSSEGQSEQIELQN